MIRTAVFVLFSIALAATTGAQDNPARVEAGGEVSLLGLKGSSAVGGAGARVAIPLTPRVAIETRATLFPKKLPPGFLTQGGSTAELQVGARAAFFARRRFSIYGVLLPGLIHFSETVTFIQDSTVRTGGATHFALDMGIGTAFRLAPRWVGHAEWTGPVYAVRGTELGRSEPSPSGAVLVALLPASVQSTSQLSAGVAYQFGTLKDTGAPAESTHPRWTIGPQFGHTTYAGDSGDVDLARSATVGAFGSARIVKWLDADGAFTALLRREVVHSPAGGGRVLQAFGGVKLGVRRAGVGYFAKIRAGVQSHDAAVTSLFTTGAAPVIGRATTNGLDVGAVIESYLARGLLLRIDAGDIVTFTQVESRDSINVAIGIGWRLGR